MKYAIVFSSPTGNTERLAVCLKEYLPQEDCVYYGAPDEKALTAPLIFVGFWTDKGNCDESTKAFLKMLKEQKVFLFGTAGFGGNAAYFEKILDAVKTNICETVRVSGDFMCQGKMPSSVLARYEKMLADSSDPVRIQGMIYNFHSAVAHPEQTDFDNLKKAVGRFLEEWGISLPVIFHEHLLF